MKPEIIYYSGYKIHYIAVIKKGLIISVACSENSGPMYNESSPFLSIAAAMSVGWKLIEVQVQDLALYTHWPVHTKEFWDLLNET